MRKKNIKRMHIIDKQRDKEIKAAWMEEKKLLMATAVSCLS